MAFYQGKELASVLIDKIMTLLTTPPQGSVDPYWTRVESGGYANEGFILKSTGKSGNERIFLRMRQASAVTYYFEFSMIEDYQPNAVQGLNGVVTNEGPKQPIYWCNTTYPTNAPVNYWLSFDKDKIMIALMGERSVNGFQKTFTYIGLPERLYTTTANPPLAAMCHASSRLASGLGPPAGDTSYGICMGLRNKARAALPTYTMVFLNKWKSKGWGDNILLSDIFMYHNDNEGLRVKMSGLKSLQPAAIPEYRDGDEITVGSKRYTIHNVFQVGTGSYPNCFPTAWVAAEQIQ